MRRCIDLSSRVLHSDNSLYWKNKSNSSKRIRSQTLQSPLQKKTNKQKNKTTTTTTKQLGVLPNLYECFNKPMEQSTENAFFSLYNLTHGTLFCNVTYIEQNYFLTASCAGDLDRARGTARRRYAPTAA